MARGLVLLGLAVILAAAKVGGYAARRLGQVAVLGELLAGVVLGNVPGGGAEWLRADPTIDLLARVGVLVLLFEVGLDLTVREVVTVGRSAVAVAVLGTVCSLLCGAGAAMALRPHDGAASHVFLGAALTATSVGITARVFKDLGRTRDPAARVVLGAAIVDDVLGLSLLTMVTGLAAAAGASARSSVALAGAFTAGLLLDAAYAPRFVARGTKPLRALVAPVSSFLVPVFFVVTGARVDLHALVDVHVLVAASALTLAALLGKMACPLGARGVRALPVAFGMVPRGEVTLVYAGIGRALIVDGKPVLDDALYSALVFVVVATTFVAPPALKWAFGPREDASAPAAP